MMHFHGFKSKAALKAAIKERPVLFSAHAEETSFFGPEYKPGVARPYAVCMDPQKRTRFANIHVNADGLITKVE
jgi:hypothetical protein